MYKKNRFIVILLVLSLLATFGLMGCGNKTDTGDADADKQPAKQHTEIITIGTATVGGAWYSMGGGLASILTDAIPGLKVTSTQSGASVENLMSIRDGKMEIGFATADIPYNMHRGVGGQEKNEAFSTLCMNDKTYLALVVKEGSAITKFDDIKGKKLGTGVAGSSNYIIVEKVLNAHGMTYNDVKPFPAGVAQQVDALKDDNIDMFAYVVAGSTGAAPAILDLVSTTKVRFIPLSDEAMTKVNNETPAYVKDALFPGWCDQVNESVPCLSVATAICVSNELSDDLVYDIIKTIFDRNEDLKAVHPTWASTNKETAALNIPAPLHPGAERYYKENGIPITALK